MDHPPIPAALPLAHGGDAADAAKCGKKRGSYNWARSAAVTTAAAAASQRRATTARSIEKSCLESVGVKLAKDGAIEVDEYSQTSVSSIWAVGDVTNRINLTPVALMEGEALVKTLFQDNPKNLIIAVPSAVFSQPPIGQVGLTEEQAVQQYGDIDIFTANFRPLKATLSGLPDRVFMKLVVCAKTNEVLGLHMCGEDAPEIVQIFVLLFFDDKL
ncbi:hypothetical protein JHK87_003971 [Glycine soja]|nr:hypothetical protein JHK87_003971 [Glycine soja]